MGKFCSEHSGFSFRFPVSGFRFQFPVSSLTVRSCHNPLSSEFTMSNRTSFSSRQVILSTANGFPQKGFALLVNGYWAVRGNGFHIWATSADRAMALSGNCATGVATTPANFVGWADEVQVATPGPFARNAATAPVSQAAPVVTPAVQTAPRTVPMQAAVTRPRSAAQCRATLSLTTSNAVRCERGEIGGDLGKARKGVMTALGNYQAACGREGLVADRDIVDNALYAAGVETDADSEAV